MKSFTSMFTLLYVLSGFFLPSAFGDCVDQTTGECCCAPQIVEVQQTSGCCASTPEPDTPLFQKSHTCFCNVLPAEDAPQSTPTLPPNDARDLLGSVAVLPATALHPETPRRTGGVPHNTHHPVLHPPPVRIQLCSFRL